MQGQRRAKPRTSLYKQLLSGSLLCLTLLGPGLTTRGQDREMKCHAAPCPQKAGSHGSNPLERSRQIPEASGRRDAIRSTATSIPGEAGSREQWSGTHGPTMQVHSQQESGKQ